jgi:N-dimethylarginine dimethylaminohydrolase
MTTGGETSPLRRLLLKHARDAYRDDATIDAQWRALNFTARPDVSRARDEYDRFVDLIARTGVPIDWLPRDDGATLDSIYVRDASVATARGMVLCAMGKAARAGEPRLQADAFGRLGIAVAGEITGPGRLEGGDVTWLGDRIAVVGRGYRTNDDGIAQFRAILGDSVDELIVVALPHWRGPSDVFHLMSILSPVDDDLAVVYSPLMPVPLRERLLDRGIGLVEVPDEEFETMGANVLAVAPRRCVMIEGNPITRARLERAGAEVVTYDGMEISLKGGGGPTCLTRPLARG